jgi:hypothetical protein
LFTLSLYLEFGREHEAFMTLPNLPTAKKIRYGMKQSRPALMSFEPEKFNFEGCVKFNTTARDSWTYLKQHYGNPKTEDPLISAYSAFLHETNPQKNDETVTEVRRVFHGDRGTSETQQHELRRNDKIAIREKL